MKDKVFNYLGLAARGRLLVNGYNTCIFMAGKGKIKLIIMAEDISENSAKKMIKLATSRNIPCRTYGSKESLSHITGKTDSGIFGITDENITKAILEEIDHKKS